MRNMVRISYDFILNLDFFPFRLPHSYRRSLNDSWTWSLFITEALEDLGKVGYISMSVLTSSKYWTYLASNSSSIWPFQLQIWRIFHARQMAIEIQSQIFIVCIQSPVFRIWSTIIPSDILWQTADLLSPSWGVTFLVQSTCQNVSNPSLGVDLWPWTLVSVYWLDHCPNSGREGMGRNAFSYVGGIWRVSVSLPGILVSVHWKQGSKQ